MWLHRHRNLVFLVAILVIGCGGFLATKLSLRSDLSSLLPPSKQSVKDLEILKHRARSFGNVIVMITAPTPAEREVAAKELEAKLRAIDPALLATVSLDENEGDRFGWAHRFLFASVEDLQLAKRALEDRLRRARLAANPAYIDLDDDAPSADGDRFAALEQRLDETEARAAKPPGRVSNDLRSQLFTLTVTFPSSDIARGRVMMAKVRAIGAQVQASHRGVTLQYAGSINISILEHDSVIAGMSLSAALTVLIVMFGLLYYFRTILPVLGTLFALLTGVGFTLGFTALTIGHLNLLSAFLTAIVVGNGINPGLIVLARFGDEVRDGAGARTALPAALAGSLHGTLGASLTAAVAYGALIITDFRGFRHFGIIGAVGMIACWIAAYTVLPVVLLWLAERKQLHAWPAAPIGDLLERLAPRGRRGMVLGLGMFLCAGAIAVTVKFIADDPFEKDWRGLQADGTEITKQRAVDQVMLKAFSNDDKALKSTSYQLVIAVTDEAQVAPVIAYLKAEETKRAKGQELFVDIKSLADLVPPDQDAKLVLLRDIAKLFEDPILGQLDDDERAKLARLRPPETIPKLSVADVPPELARLFVEQNGEAGKLIYVKGSGRFQTWNVDDRVVFAEAVRRLELPEGVVIGGEPLVIADIVSTMEHDAPRMIVVSLLGSLFAVWLVVRLRRHGIITMVCGIAGVVVMIAVCALVGLKVHFLDLIALPITIGIGIDYAVNLVARDRQEPGIEARRLLATTGAAVMLCSFTTTVGYGSLLLSSNGGVRAFGLAAIIGEITCLVMALVLAPALLASGRRASPAG